MNCLCRLCRAVVLSFTVSLSLNAAPAPEHFSPEMQKFVNSFQGHGALGDTSKPLTPEETIQHFKLADGLQMDVVAHEPIISQPLNLHFDERGRLWVVQYLQYPFPAGLKVVKYDQYLRAVYDKVPEPPPRGVKGLDKITILEDSDGDGVFEKHKDFVTGLNITTSVCVGRGGVWVLNPPYLLFYPDRNRDDVPDGDPEVVLSGFGMEDTHSLASSLIWGPDGWLYGAHGSTSTGFVKGIRFLGQCIWRYQPVTKEFEIFAEGGGNTWSLDFDSEGRAFSGTNGGGTRGLNYVQGGCYVKNWGKHGPLINPYAFGFYEHMAHKGFQPRFAQSMVIYEGGAIPGLEGKFIASMALVNRVQASEILPDTSTFQTVDTDPLVLTDDHWFRPVDTRVGPDGAIYLADWYDSRLSHLDPRDTWDHERGRIYRLKAKGSAPTKPFDLGKASNDELIKLLDHPNKWYRQMALRLIGDRNDAGMVPKLKQIVAADKGRYALEALWAIHLNGGFTDDFALQQLSHPNPFVRAWTVRLLGDEKKVSPAIAVKLAELAHNETNAEVRSQMASSAKRLPAADALPIVRELVLHDEDTNDKFIPLLLWWAMESKAASDRTLLLEKLQETRLWAAPIFQKYLASRLGQRYTAERSEANFATCAQLLKLAPTPNDVDLIIKGMEQGLQGDIVKSVPQPLQQTLQDIWQTRPHTATLVSCAARLGYAEATSAALERVGDPKAPAAERKQFLTLLSERRETSAVPVFLKLLREEKSDSVRLEALNALQRFGDGDIARTVLELYPQMSQKLRASAQVILTSRVEWARLLLEAVDKGSIKRDQLTPANIAAVQNLHDAQSDALIKKHWGALQQSSAEKEARETAIRKLLATGKGDFNAGHELFKNICAACHTLNGEGAKIGPDLTGYERDNLDFMLPAIVDPSLAIREEFIAFNVTTKDDQSLLGFIDENTPKSITLRDLSQNKIVIAREDIKKLEASKTSVMPEGLLDAMTEQNIRDLFAYLTKRK